MTRIIYCCSHSDIKYKSEENERIPFSLSLLSEMLSYPNIISFSVGDSFYSSYVYRNDFSLLVSLKQSGYCLQWTREMDIRSEEIHFNRCV